MAEAGQGRDVQGRDRDSQGRAGQGKAVQGRSRAGAGHSFSLSVAPQKGRKNGGHKKGSGSLELIDLHGGGYAPFHDFDRSL